jgi:hypothetical protein
MHKDFEIFIEKRCSEALIECEKYIKEEYDSTVDSDTLQTHAEILCYKKGFSDALEVMMYSQKLQPNGITERK